MKLTKTRKKHIDRLDYLHLLNRWRFASIEDHWIEGETGNYWEQRLAGLWDKGLYHTISLKLEKILETTVIAEYQPISEQGKPLPLVKKLYLENYGVKKTAIKMLAKAVLTKKSEAGDNWIEARIAGKRIGC